ncbi:hypothetical protein ANANG_G00286290 [Anguilla anguilla]|uniref:Uncharacterized protein n=1 Tax=Anguilla anguilla TaxID=7936 RepID=A0A9D3LM00_ANGAN|nr:hypothetical protein ANANG_G00286290 [Anguilla anguilla]
MHPFLSAKRIESIDFINCSLSLMTVPLLQRMRRKGMRSEWLARLWNLPWINVTHLKTLAQKSPPSRKGAHKMELLQAQCPDRTIKAFVQFSLFFLFAAILDKPPDMKNSG